MTTKQMTKLRVPNGIQKMGIKALARELGVVNMARFVQIFDPGKGNYTQERDALLAGTTMADIESQLAKLNREREKAISKARKATTSRKPAPSRKVKATAKTAASRRKVVTKRPLAHA